MILADKIADLRKKNGWSQEELAGRLGVSRQAVSKWESAVSVPDLDKIIRLSELFEVSTDYLLKDDSEYTVTDIASDNNAEGYMRGSDAADEKLYKISMEDANYYLELVKNTSPKIAFGVMLCIISPMALIWLGALSDDEGGHAVSEALAVGMGMTTLLVLVASAVAIFLIYGRKLEAFEFLETEQIELSYGVKGMVEKEKHKYENMHSRRLVIGIILCILSVVPLMVLGAAYDNGMFAVLGAELLLGFVAVGVYLIVDTCSIYGGFQKLLEEGDYTKYNKLENKRNDNLATVYWCVVVAVYLGWSFITMDWHRTWIIWPVAAVLYAALLGIARILRRNS